MEPPCEHGGVIAVAIALSPSCLLQWSRRVNTAEWFLKNASVQAQLDKLQWSRRVNTAECETGPNWRSTAAMLQWSRRVNTAECPLTRTK